MNETAGCRRWKGWCNGMFQGNPVIALTPLLDEERESYWMLPGYMKALEEQGAIPVMPPLTNQPDVPALRQSRPHCPADAGRAAARLAANGGMPCQQLSPSGHQRSVPLVPANGHRAGRPYRGDLYAGPAVCLGRPVAPGAFLSKQRRQPEDPAGFSGCGKAAVIRKAVFGEAAAC